jgi:hypothetical protein
MTISNCIDRVQELKPHAYKPEEVTAWLSALDGQISLEVIGAEDATSYAYPDDGDKELLAAAPYDEMYIYYVMAMVDFYNREMTAYANDMEMFNSAIGNFRSYYIRAYGANSASSGNSTAGQTSAGGWNTI